jgi:hypothetical protein
MSVPVIRVEPGQLAPVVDAAVEALRAATFGLLAFNGNTPCFKPESGCKGAELSDDGLALLLARAARWEDADGKPIDPPARVVGGVRAELTIRVLTNRERSRARREGRRAVRADELVSACQAEYRVMTARATVLRQYARENPGDAESQANVEAVTRALDSATDKYREALRAQATAEAKAEAEEVARYLAEREEPHQ